MSCQHDGRRPYSFALGRKTTVLCPDCFGRMAALGMALTPVERRIADEPVATERRHSPVPRWLGRLTARVTDSWRAAA